ncbi:kinase [Alkalihalobacillus alcalophilus ATCC 27647 = CGMCC 1.3604]|uniref:Kinase n=1 Tax=Alkalihalobacillus alcalophilus ATCC 27647 = CGMCC 1.3604 TaxID=1218173 RepID=A0A4S4K299_ALKAL|nr:sporulation phosphorelay system protein KapB [Alkalihalobacillus alcalophilus]MED1562532.1 sporulation phosphorelay system protein KapB [Alkalihalobacillus alcalophilus]THG90109.1 kinase [Alkalihalobacillus alcalophilus ATCC 27647 = CGMCC 1.3604]
MEAQIVQAVYKTGVYIGECLQVKEAENKALVKVVAVKKHPQQGDLHHPKQTEGVFFHERKALAQFEKAWMPLSSLKSYQGEVLEYKESLSIAWNQLHEKLKSEETDFNLKSLEKLNDLKKEYRFE